MLKRIEAAGYSAVCVTVDCRPGVARAQPPQRLHRQPQVITGNYRRATRPGREVFGQLFDCDEPVWPWSRLGRLMESPACRGSPRHPYRRGRPGGGRRRRVRGPGLEPRRPPARRRPGRLDQLPEVASAVAGGRGAAGQRIRSGRISSRRSPWERAQSSSAGSRRPADRSRRRGVTRCSPLAPGDDHRPHPARRGSVTELTADALQVRRP